MDVFVGPFLCTQKASKHVRVARHTLERSSHLPYLLQGKGEKAEPRWQWMKQATSLTCEQKGVNAEMLSTCVSHNPVPARAAVMSYFQGVACLMFSLCLFQAPEARMEWILEPPSLCGWLGCGYIHRKPYFYSTNWDSHKLLWNWEYTHFWDQMTEMPSNTHLSLFKLNSKKLLRVSCSHSIKH